MIQLDGQVALVSGGSRGIGRACCEALARCGARVAVNYCRDRDAAEAVVAAIGAGGGSAIAIGADVSRADDAARLVTETVEAFGALSVVVNNAGIWNRAAIETMSDTSWRTMLEVNLNGTFHVIRAAVPHLKRAGGGRIINISSTAGQRGEAHHAHYAATKGAVIALTKSLAAELGPAGILTNCVAPGWVHTEMSAAALEGQAGRLIEAGIPLGRAGRPEEIAGAVVFLASALSTFVNGEVLNVNGGAVLCG